MPKPPGTPGRGKPPANSTLVTVAATLLQARDTCVATVVLPATATIAVTQVGDSVNIASTGVVATQSATLALQQRADTCHVSVSSAFSAPTAHIQLQQARDGCSISVSPAAQPITTADWTLLSSGTPIGFNPFYFLAATRYSNGDVWLLWNSTWVNPSGTGAWVDKGTTNVGVDRYENTYAICDPNTDKVYVLGGGFPANSDAITQNLSRGIYDFTANTYALPSVPSSGAPNGGGHPYGSVMRPYNGYIYTFGGYSGTANMSARLRISPLGSAWESVVQTSGLPDLYTEPLGKYTMFRGGLDSRSGNFWVIDGSNLLWIGIVLYGGTQVTWNQVATTGTTLPPVTPQAGIDTVGSALVADCYESRNQIVAWIGDNTPNSGYIGQTQRRTFVLDLGTRVWSESVTTHKPANTVQASHVAMYDKPRDRLLLVQSNVSTFQADIWQYAAPAPTGVISSFPLPASVGGVYGQNFFSFPYCSNNGSKNTNLAYCPLNDRIYVSGGDVSPGQGSATDGIWSMSCTDGTWRLDFGLPVYPSSPAPSAGQDGALLIWMANRQKFLFVPGYYFGPYGWSVPQYENGIWWFDPVALTWENFIGAFNQPMGGLLTGSIYGGCYDATNDQLVAAMDDQIGRVVRRWNMANQTRLSDIPITGLVVPPGYAALYYGLYCRQVLVGRLLYVVGYATDGIVNTPVFFKVNIDTGVATMLTPPVIPNFSSQAGSLQLGVSNGKIIFPYAGGGYPDGTMPLGILVFDPGAGTWTADTQVPSYGNFLVNAVACSETSDHKLYMAGAEFGSPQTHIWSYKAN